MKHPIYLNAKCLLIKEAKEIKRLSNDKGYIDQSINDQVDQIIKQINHYKLIDRISAKQAELYTIWLSNLAAKLYS